MMFKIFFTVWTVCALNHIEAYGQPAYSAVNVQSKSEFLPYTYPAPTYNLPSTYARLSAPITPVLPGNIPTSLTPCVAPCIPLSQYIGQVIPIPPALDFNSLPRAAPAYGPPAESSKAKITEEAKSPQPKEDNSYQYSYLVYDENTGDQKAQHESSDGSKVQGQYSLIQPDGYIREVQYTADDLSGFNAVVKNFLPNTPNAGTRTAEGKRKFQNLKSSSTPELIQKPDNIEIPAKESTEVVDIDGPKVEPLDKITKENVKESKEVKKDGSRKIFLTFEDIIRCANIMYGNSNKDGLAATDKPNSALTYIVLPSFGLGKPC